MRPFPPFTDIQPPKAFVDELKRPLHTSVPPHFKAGRTLKRDEIFISGIYIDKTYPDPESLLETVYDDFEAFADVCGIAGKKYPVRLIYDPDCEKEEHIISITPENITVSAGDTEGIRRAVYFLEDLMTKRGGPILKCGSIRRRSWMKTRISRCFFSPRNRSGREEDDELVNGNDYYPDNYLARLAHDGVNGLWIYTHMATLTCTTLHPEMAGKSELRQKNLNRII